LRLTSFGYFETINLIGGKMWQVPNYARRYLPRKRKQTVLPFKRVECDDMPMERNDCTVIALSQATPLTYHEAHDIMRDAGRKFGHGFPFQIWMKNHEEVSPGIKLVTVYDWTVNIFHPIEKNLISGPKNSKELTLGQFVKSNPEGNYIVIVRRHATTVIDGVIHDTFRQGPRKRISKVYKVELI
jgi:hypothetical protein